MKTGIIFDFNRTLFDPSTYALYPGVLSLLERLSHRTRILYSKRADNREELIRTLGLRDKFDGIYFVPHKTKENLIEITAAHALEPRDCVIVGDMIADELCIGSELGMHTVWFCPLPPDVSNADTLPCVPNRVVSSITELSDYLASVA